MKYLYPLLTLCLLIYTSCQKLDNATEIKTPASGFKLSADTAYLTQVIDVIPALPAGQQTAWTCNFGDGTQVISGNIIMNVSHMYTRWGVYNVTFTAGANKFILPIYLYDGLRSYYIKNSLSKSLSVSTQIEGLSANGHNFGVLKPGMVTDAACSLLTDTKPFSLVVYGTYTGSNQIVYNYYTASLPAIPQYKNTFIELKDTEPIFLRYTVNGTPTTVQSTFADLFKY